MTAKDITTFEVLARVIAAADLQGQGIVSLAIGMRENATALRVALLPFDTTEWEKSK